MKKKRRPLKASSIEGRLVVLKTTEDAYVVMDVLKNLPDEMGVIYTLAGIQGEGDTEICGRNEFTLRRNVTQDQVLILLKMADQLPEIYKKNVTEKVEQCKTYKK